MPVKERMCDYGNCEETKVAVTVNFKNEERPAFCCAEHAAMWLLKRDSRLNKFTLSDLDWLTGKVQQ
jgi:hypothetical protein